MWPLVVWVAVVVALVEAMGGHIKVQSPGLGRRTTFTVTLPVTR